MRPRPASSPAMPVPALVAQESAGLLLRAKFLTDPPIRGGCEGRTAWLADAIEPLVATRQLPDRLLLLFDTHDHGLELDTTR